MKNILSEGALQAMVLWKRDSAAGVLRKRGLSRNRNGISEHVKRRMDIASETTNQLNKRIYRPRNIELKAKVNLHKSLVNSILLYNAKCWQIGKADEVRLFPEEMLEKITKTEPES